MKVAVLWTRFSGFLGACLKRLSEYPNVEILVVFEAPSDEAPYDGTELEFAHRKFSYRGAPRFEDIAGPIAHFDPDIVLVCSWHIGAYRQILKRLPATVPRVLYMDNQWRGTLKQWIGVASAPWYLHRLYDVAFLPGHPQAQFACRLGFKEHQIWRGALSCDQAAFAAAGAARGHDPSHKNSFLYVGRLSPEKGVDVLIEAYRCYRAHAADPWKLIICGAGPLAEAAQGVAGVEPRGFVQPRDLPRVFATADCLVMPSRFEQWGVAIHEATSAGLPVICTVTCGASVHLVQDGYNGYLVEAGNAEMMARTLAKLGSLPEGQRQQMGRASRSLSEQFTPDQWARNFYERATNAIRAKLGYRVPPAGESAELTHAHNSG